MKVIFKVRITGSHIDGDMPHLGHLPLSETIECSGSETIDSIISGLISSVHDEVIVDKIEIVPAVKAGDNG